MKQILLLLILFSSPVIAQSTKVTVAKSAKVEEEIKKIELELESAVMSGNADKYATYLADDYVLINAAGLVASREQILAALKASGPSKGDSLFPDNLKVRVYGEAAVLNGHLTWRGTDNGQKLTRESLFTKVFVRRKGHWYMVNSQGTALPQR